MSGGGPSGEVRCCSFFVRKLYKFQIMTACPVVRFWAFFEGRNFRTDFGISEVTESIGYYQSKQVLAEKKHKIRTSFFGQHEDFPDKLLDNILGLKCGKNQHLVKKTIPCPISVLLILKGQNRTGQSTLEHFLCGPLLLFVWLPHTALLRLIDGCPTH